MTFLGNYILFITKCITLLGLLFVFLASIIASASKAKSKKTTKISARSLNKHYQALKQTISELTLDKKSYKAQKKEQKVVAKKHSVESKPRLFIINFKGDVQAKATTALTEQINTILLSHQSSDEVLLRLESPGGVVPGYGLAAAQLARLREKNIPLTIAIDKVAASGGYLMASVANQIIAAPLAIIGSIGVIAQLPNFNRLLEKNHIDYEQIMAGKHKRTLTMFGNNTDQGREKLQDEVNETLTLFKNHIHKYRPQVIIDDVATGEHWYGSQALDLKLIDYIQTSDDYLLSTLESKQLIEIDCHQKQSKIDKLIKSTYSAYQKLVLPKGGDFFHH